MKKEIMDSFGKIRSMLSEFLNHIIKPFYALLYFSLVVCVSYLIFFWTGIYYYYGCLFVFIASFALFFSLVIVRFVCTKRKLDGKIVTFSVLLFLLMVIMPFTVPEITTNIFKTPDYTSVIVERYSLEPVAVILAEKEQAKTFPESIIYNNSFVNCFRYMVIPGIPASGSIRTYAKLTSGNYDYYYGVVINYKVPPVDFLEAQKNFFSKKEFETYIIEQFNACVLPDLQVQFDKVVAGLDKKQISGSEILFQYVAPNGLESFGKDIKIKAESWMSDSLHSQNPFKINYADIVLTQAD